MGHGKEMHKHGKKLEEKVGGVQNHVDRCKTLHVLLMTCKHVLLFSSYLSAAYI
uniref:Uncharacterized protein n=1 Tax=Rhizophora mucronata TaxID=61149 RepID=A0A2P2Q180_RHIMU